MIGGLFGIALQILFIALKLTEQIDWSWWWVLSPLIVTVMWVVLWFCAVIGFLMVQTRRSEERLQRRYRPRRE